MNADDGRGGADLLIKAGAVVSSSLDLSTTMRRVARLTVPAIADICVIDLLAEDGTISDVAVAARDDAIESSLTELRRRNPVDPHGSHPVAEVIAAGSTRLLAEMSPPMLRSFAQDTEHARFMLASGYRSAIVAPLAARSRTLGAISVLRVGEREAFAGEDVEIVEELAGRAAMAIDNARLFGRLQALERRQEAILENIAEAITVEDAGGRIVFANRAAAELLGVAGPEAVVEAERASLAAGFLIRDESARELDLDALPGRRLLRGESVEPLLVHHIVRSTGEERWLMVRSSPVPTDDGRHVEFAVNVFEDITQLKRVQLAESFMAQASRVLASSMDYRETLRRVARLAVPQLADWCAIDLLDDAGQLRQVAIHHADPAKLALAERLRRERMESLGDPGGVAEVIRSGVPFVRPQIDPDALEAYARDAHHLDLLRAVGPVSVIIVPLLSAVQAIGAITLVSSESMRRLGDADVALAERLGRRAGTAVENARLYTERGRIAHELQRSLLPESLPSIPGVSVRARYHAAGELNEVGGDFYDVFPAEGDRWIVVIGDVVGKGARAAGVTALARHTLRAAAFGGAGPTEMLEILHRALRAQPPGADLCTVCLIALHPAERSLRATLTLAGHPPPLLLEPSGAAAAVGQTGTLLGVLDRIRLHESELELGAGQTLLLYTDGVLDAGRRSAPLGETGLRELCARHAGLGLEELLQRIEADVLARAGDSIGDDIALLALRVGDAR